MKPIVSHAGAFIVCLLSLGNTFAAPPATPQNLRPAWTTTFLAPAEAFAIWEPATGVDSYNVYRADDANTNWMLIASGVTVPFFADPLASFLPSYYTVTAVNADGESFGAEPTSVFASWSDSIDPVPIHPLAGTLSPTNAIVQWHTLPGGAEGLVEWGPALPSPTNYTFYSINTNYLTDPRFDLTNLTPATRYQYRITSINPIRGGTRWTNFFTTPDTNHAPVVTYLIPYPGTPVGIQFWITDTDQPPQTITFQISQPAHGALSGPWQQWGPEGISWGIWYQPNDGARGVDSFTILANDGVENSTPATMTVSNWLNRLPVAGYISTNLVEDTPTLISLPNFDVDRDALTFDINYVFGGTVSGNGPDFLFTPDLNRIGEGSISYRVSDGYGTNFGFMQINITPVNDRPVAYSASFTTYEDMPVFTWLNWSDVEYGVLFAVSIVRPPAHGNMSGDIFQLQYTPAPNFYGEDSFDFVIVEPDGTTSDPATVTIQVTGLNDPPTVPAQTVLTPEDTPVSFALSASDPEGDPLTYWINSGPSHGTLSGTLPNLTYTPEAGYMGYDTFNYSATDGLESRPNNVTIGVGQNSLPPISGLHRRIYSDGVVRLSWNAISNATSYNLYRADTAAGPFTLLSGNLTTTNFNDVTAEFQHTYWYRVRSWDGATEGGPGTALARWDSTGVINLNQQLWVIRGTTAQLQFCTSLAMGAEGLGEFGTTTNYGLTIENTNLLGCQHFAVSNLTPQTIYYYRLTATDSNGNALAYQNSFVTESPPTATAQSVSTAEDNPVNITLSGTDPNNHGYMLTCSIVTSPAHGTLSFISGQTWRYLPATNYNGSDSFTFKVNNGELNSTPATVSINVTAVNDAPVAINQSITMGEDTQRNITLIGSDAEGGALTFQIITGPAHGTFTGTPPNLIYLPATNYFGTDNFTFRVLDAQIMAATGSVSLTITNINDRPVATTQSLTTPEDTSLLVSVAGTDPDGDPLTMLILTLPAHGTLSAPTTTNVVYTPSTNYTGPDSFTFRVYDGKLTSTNPASVNITVTAANDRPVANPQSVSTLEDTSKVITLSGTDVEGGALTYSISSGPAHGTLTGSGATRTYTPATNYFGADSFSFVANDGATSSAPAIVSITITNVNDAPVANPQSVLANENASTNIVLGGSDVEGSPLAFAIVTGPANGALSGTAPNVTYTPNTGFEGSDSIQFSVSDGSLFSTNVVSITVMPVNDPPIANPQSISLDEDAAMAVTLTGSDSNGDALTYAVISAPTHGALSGSAPNLTYTPTANYNGPDSLTFSVSDGPASVMAVVSITVLPVNDAPAATPLSVTLSEDGSTNIVLSGTDVDGDPLSYAITGDPTNGTLSGTAPNVTYTPNANFNGPDNFQFSVSDGVLSSTNVVSFTIVPVNDAPVASPQSVSVDEDATATVTLSGIDLEGDALTYSVLTSPGHGTLSGTAPNLTYTPAANYNGPDSFTFSVSDGTASAVAAVTITVQPVNDAPGANPQPSLSLAEDSSLSITLTGTDVDGDALTFLVVTSPANGTLSGTAPNLTYTPNTNFNGSDSFTFKANDGLTNGNIATVSIQVTGVNDAPVAGDFSVSTDEDVNVPVTLTANDPEGQTLIFTIVSPPTRGTLLGTAPNLTYRPNLNMHGLDTFTFRASDGTANGNIATVTIDVHSVNDLPVALSWDDVPVNEDGVLDGMLYASDADGDALTFRIVSFPTNGTLGPITGNPPFVRYTPNANFNGSDAYTYVANDGTGDGPIATVRLSVVPLNDAPTAQIQFVSTIEDTPLPITLTAVDVDGDALTFSIVAAPTNGVLSGAGSNLTYTPNPNSFGADRFSFRANDGTLDSSPASIIITVTPMNDAPVANPQSVSLNEDTVTAITLTATDVESGSLSYSVLTSPAHGTLSGTAPNLTYTPAANYNGPDSFTFSASDGTLSSTNVVSISVAAVNDVPVANTQLSVSVNEDSSVGITLTGSDVDGDALTFSIVTPPAHGALSGTAPNLTYTPSANFNGADNFSFKVSDGTADSASANIPISVTALNDAPVADPQSVNTPEDTGVSITLTGTDADGNPLTYSIVTAPTHGTLNTNAGATVTYTPAANYNGPDSFAFRVSDGSASNTATVSINVTPVNDAPVANPQSVSLAEDSSLAVTLTGSDVEGSALTFSMVAMPAHGTLNGTAPNLTYRPATNYTGTDSFTFTASDGSLNSSAATININMTAVNDTPIANPQSVSVAEDSSLAIALTGSDVEGSALTYTVLSSPTHGTLTGTAPNLTYRPATNYNGADSFTFRVNDGSLNSGTATVNINVTSVNDAPVANPQSVTVTYNTAKAITLAGSDLESGALTYSIVTAPTNGTLSGTAPNVTYTPIVGSAGADRFTFRGNDGVSNSAAATVSITTQSPAGIPAAPSSLTVTVPTATGTLILNWSCTATNEDGFKIERSLNGSSGWSQIATTGINIHTFTNTGLTSNTRYYYRVRSYNRLGNSAYSNTANAKAR